MSCGCEGKRCSTFLDCWTPGSLVEKEKVSIYYGLEIDKERDQDEQQDRDRQHDPLRAKPRRLGRHGSTHYPI